jgi:hypothetical protein
VEAEGCSLTVYIVFYLVFLVSPFLDDDFDGVFEEYCLQFSLFRDCLVLSDIFDNCDCLDL